MLWIPHEYQEIINELAETFGNSHMVPVDLTAEQFRQLRRVLREQGINLNRLSKEFYLAKAPGITSLAEADYAAYLSLRKQWTFT